MIGGDSAGRRGKPCDKTFGAYSELSYTSWRNIEVEEVEDWDDVEDDD